jgi:hypothetical protein
MGVHVASFAPPGATRCRGIHERVGGKDKPAPSGGKDDGGGSRPERSAKLGVESEDPLIVASVGGHVGQLNEPDEENGAGLVVRRP